MTPQALLIEVTLLEKRWQGVGDWPPSPFRLFQALVAGAYGGRWVAEDATVKDAAFRWLECLDPPAIAAPPRTAAGRVTYYVPNNDLDAVGGDPARVGEIRSAKETAPILIEGAPTFVSVWRFAPAPSEIESVCVCADRLHTFGRGLDAAFARASVVTTEAAEAALEDHGGANYRPCLTGRGSDSPCPMPGSLDSLKTRHAAVMARFQTIRVGRKNETAFRQAPKAVFRPVAYDSPPTRLYYTLRQIAAPTLYTPVPRAAVLSLTEAVRNRAAERLAGAAPDLATKVERFFVGRGAGSADAGRRVRILPLATLGHPHASPSIRRILVEIPPDCPLRPRDLAWALDGLDLGEATAAPPCSRGRKRIA